MNFSNIKDINGNIYNFKIINNKIKFTKEINIDCINKENWLVSDGWIDAHAHFDHKNEFLNSNPDFIGYKSGVTMVIDAGSTGVSNLDNLFEIRNEYITNIRVLLNISSVGIPAQNELRNLDNINISYNFEKYKDFVIGYKARISSSVVGENGIKPLEIFNKLRIKNYMPIMIHIGHEPPLYSQIIDNLQNGDILTHVFNGKNESMFLSDGTITNNYIAAKNKGIIFDIGHGSESMDSKLAINVKSKNKDFNIDIISTDIYYRNIENKIVKNLANVMSKFKKIGYEWHQIIDCVTRAPRETFKIGNYGVLQENNIANLTFYKIEKGKFDEIDSKGNKIILEEKIIPVGVLINGKFYHLEEIK